MSTKSNSTRIRTIIPEQEVIAESDAMLNVLHSEVNTILEKTREEPRNQRWRRVFVRSLFAYIEGSCFRMKQDALFFDDEFTPGEIILLEEKEYSLKNNGNVKERNAHLRSEDNLKFSFMMLAKALGRDFELNLQGNGWVRYQKALKIRDRITHPKKIQNLAITDSEFDIVLDAWEWFHKQLNELFKPSLKV